jgi:proteasome assembly chaperone (PAC2) family protein
VSDDPRPSRLFELHERPDLDTPVMVVALDGWIDAGLGAATALTTIAGQADLATVATFDTDQLLDHRARRPTMELVDGIVERLTWPTLELQATTDPLGTEVLLLVGAEPDHTWRAFAGSVVDLALEFGTRLVVGLGAYPAPVPHTRPTRLVATATNRELADLVGYVHGRIEVPTGVSSAIERRCAEVGLPAVGLWAQVPHYAAAMPYPAASEALIRGLARVADLAFGTADLTDEGAEAIARIDSLIAGNQEHLEMVRQLERHVDALEADEGGRLPSVDELAAEVEQFLRDQGDTGS